MMFGRMLWAELRSRDISGDLGKVHEISRYIISSARLSYYVLFLSNINLHKFKTGVYQQNEFAEKTYADIYKGHLKSLQDWKKYTTECGTHSTAKVQKKMYEMAR